MKVSGDKLNEAVELWREYGECDAFVEAWQAYVNTLPPPKPPIDTSLAASIKRFEMVPNGWLCQEYIDSGSLIFEDRDRVIDAARKWDEHCRKHEWPSFTHPEAVAAKSAMVRTAKKILSGLSTDPDGVGEGWRRVQQWRMVETDEALQKGDEALTGTCNGEKCWTPIAGMFGKKCGRQVIRRRIEAER